MILKDVTVGRLDLDGKLRVWNNIPHILVVDREGSTTFVRLGNKGIRTIDDAQLAEVETLQVGNIIDVEVRPVEWSIQHLSGTSYFYQSHKRSALRRIDAAS